MEVKVEWAYTGGDPVAGNNSGTLDWYDITSWAYSGGTVRLDGVFGQIDKVALRITAKATYETHDYRWDLKNGVLESATVDGVDYNVSGTIDYNDTTVKMGSYGDTGFVDAHLGLNDRIILRDEEPWVIEWKTSGAVTGILLSNDGHSTTRNNYHIYCSNSGKRISIGYRNDRNSRHDNFAADISALGTTNVYRLVNSIASNGSNTVYLYLNDVQVGAMNSYYRGSASQNTTDDWVTGRDLAFSFFGTDDYPIDGKLEYVQIWEGGDFNTTRLEQLIAEYDELKDALSGCIGFDSYTSAVETAKDHVQNKETVQSTYDQMVSDIINARNELTQNASANAGQILSVELLTGTTSGIGKQTGLHVITAPDVVGIRVGTQKLLAYSSMLQTIKIDGEDVVVKVWLITWQRSSSTAKDVTYGVRAYDDLTDLETDDAAIASSGSSDSATLYSDKESITITFA